MPPDLISRGIFFIKKKKNLTDPKHIKYIVYFLNDLEMFMFLLVLTGGGSALLPAPAPPMSLQEKQDVTRKLAAAGATIQELNTVRRALSLLKGGGLAQCANPAQVTLYTT